MIHQFDQNLTGSRRNSHYMRPPVILGLALGAAYLFGLLFLPFGVAVLCGVGGVLSIRRNTSSSRF